MRTLLSACGGLVVSLAGCGGSSGDEARPGDPGTKADYWAITQIQKNFHEATSKKDIALMMSLYAPNATLTIPGQTAVGRSRSAGSGSPSRTRSGQAIGGSRRLRRTRCG